MKPKNRGCEKCDYTGFAYAKIPCECQGLEPEPPKRGVEIPISGVYSFPNGPPEIEAGDTVAIGDVIIGRALSSIQEDGTVMIAMDGYTSFFNAATKKEEAIGMTVTANASGLVVVKSNYE